MSAAALKTTPAVTVAEGGMSLGIKHALARAKEVYSKPVKTLVNQVSDEDWNNWDASDEKALVADKDGLPPKRYT